MSRGTRLVIKWLTKPSFPAESDVITNRVPFPALHAAAGSSRSDLKSSFSRKAHWTAWSEDALARNDSYLQRKCLGIERGSGVPRNGWQRRALSSLAADQQEVSSSVVDTSPSEDIPLQGSSTEISAAPLDSPSDRPSSAAKPKNKPDISTQNLSQKAFGDLLVKVTDNDPSQVFDLYEEWLGQKSAEGVANVPNVHMVHLVLQSMSKLGKPCYTMENFLDRTTKKYGVLPVRTTYNFMLTSALHRRDLEAGKRIFTRMQTSKFLGQNPDADSYNSMIFLEANHRKITAAVMHLKQMLKEGLLPSMMAYNELLRGCARTKRTREAAIILKELKGGGEGRMSQRLQPLDVVLSELVVAAGEAEDPTLAQLALQVTAEGRLQLDEGSLLIVLNFAAREGHTSITEMCWPLLQQSVAPDKPSVAAFLARMHAYASSGDIKSAFRAVADLERNHCPPDATGHPTNPEALCPFTSLRPLMLACCRNLATLDSSYERLVEMHGAGEMVPVACVNSIILGCAYLYDASRGYETFEAISQAFGRVPTIDSYSALIHCFGACKELKFAQATFESIEKNGLKPNARAYEAIVDAHITSQDARGALQLLQAMAAAGYIPQRDMLVRMYRRSQRQRLPEGWRWARQTVHELGYRDLEHEASKRKMVNEEGLKLVELGFIGRAQATRTPQRRW